MSSGAAELARRLARDAEAVCRHYLSNGRREGRYWLVGDVFNTPGRSLYLRLIGPERGKGAAGRWTDAATGQHGDLLDLIALNRGLDDFHDVLQEARVFLSMPRPQPSRPAHPAPTGSPEAARRLFAMAKPVRGTLAEAYLRARGITDLRSVSALRFHPRCYYRPEGTSSKETWPTLLAAVTDLAGEIQGIQRTWLDPSGGEKAPVGTPRKAMGELHGHGVRFGTVSDVMAAGEGLETVLSLRCVLPTMPMIAALSTSHLAALKLPNGLRRLYVARDEGKPGYEAGRRLVERAREAGVEALTLSPRVDDFNMDLRTFGVAELAGSIRVQLAPEDVGRFLSLSDVGS
jgi:hypothetical protein